MKKLKYISWRSMYYNKKPLMCKAFSKQCMNGLLTSHTLLPVRMYTALPGQPTRARNVHDPSKAV